jgi:hypothetical protein
MLIFCGIALAIGLLIDCIVKRPSFDDSSAFVEAGCVVIAATVLQSALPRLIWARQGSNLDPPVMSRMLCH